MGLPGQELPVLRQPCFRSKWQDPTVVMEAQGVGGAALRLFPGPTALFGALCLWAVGERLRRSQQW